MKNYKNDLFLLYLLFRRFKFLFAFINEIQIQNQIRRLKKYSLENVWQGCSKYNLLFISYLIIYLILLEKFSNC